MIEQAPVLIVIIPMIFAFLTPILGWIKGKLCYFWIILALLSSTLFSIITLITVLNSGVINYHLASWPPPIGIEYSIDHLNAVMLVLVSFISLMTAVSSKKIVEKEIKTKSAYFYTVFLLQTVGFFGIIITGDMFNVYVFLEIASIAGYALIAVGEDGAPLASFRYIIMGTIGACFYLLGVGYMYIMTGTLNMAELAKKLPSLYDSETIIIAASFLIVGIIIKMGVFPLHSWIPDAYTLAPSTVSSLQAPLFTKISAYLLIRVFITIYDPSFTLEKYPVNEILGWVTAAGIIFAGIMALAQTDIKRMFSYLIVAEMGYIIIGFATGNRISITGSILHIFNDVFMMACLFSAVGAIYYQTGTRNIYEFRTLHRKMPLTLAVFVIGALSVLGIPPFCGFFSKWYLILGTIHSERWAFLSVLIISSLINAVLFFRVLENAYTEPRDEENHNHHAEHRKIVSMDKIPLSMIVPMVLIAVGIILIGLFSGKIVSNIIEHVIPISL